MTLSLQSVPLHHQVQAQAHLAPDSPAPAQTPPLHALPELSPSPLPHPAMGRAPVDFSNIGSDMSTEVDSLDPSIMDFALQGEAGGMGMGGRGGEGSWTARKMREGQGEEVGQPLPLHSIHGQVLPNLLMTANYSKHFMSAYCIPGLLPSTP